MFSCEFEEFVWASFPQKTSGLLLLQGVSVNKFGGTLKNKINEISY